jgi:predicted transcriptional regulator
MPAGPLAKTGKTRLTAAERRAEALHMKLAGASGPQIAAKLGVTRQRVCQYLKQALTELNAASLDAAAELRAIEDARLEARLLEANLLVQAHKADPDVFAKLDARRQAISDAKRRLWGLDAPTRTELTGKDGGPMEVQNADAIRARLLAHFTHGVATVDAGGESGSSTADDPAGD